MKGNNGTKDYTKRANVIKWLPYWKKLVAEKGKDECVDILRKGHTVLLSRKDRLGLLQALELSTKGV